MAVDFKAGLEDVVAANSAICDVDGKAGRLRYRGYDIGDLAERASYEEVTYLLWFGDLPGRDTLQQFSRSRAGQRGGEAPGGPGPALSHAPDFPSTMPREPRAPVSAGAMPAVRVLHAEHELNA